MFKTEWMEVRIIVCLLFVSLFGGFSHGQGELTQVLNTVLQPANWGEYYCVDTLGNELLSGVLAENQIPMLDDLEFKSHWIPVRMSKSGKNERFWMRIRKVKISPDNCRVKLIYDQRIWANFKLRKGDKNIWIIQSSTFRQKSDCRDDNRKRSYKWNF